MNKEEIKIINQVKNEHIIELEKELEKLSNNPNTIDDYIKCATKLCILNLNKSNIEKYGNKLKNNITNIKNELLTKKDNSIEEKMNEYWNFESKLIYYKLDNILLNQFIVLDENDKNLLDFV